MALTPDQASLTLETISAGATVTDEGVTMPYAEAPHRERKVDSNGVGIAVYEWGPVDGPPIALIHGGFDFARTYDVFAGLLASQGWRVFSWDHRNHGNSDRAALTSWAADSRDAATVINSVSRDPMPVIGHSKGGAMSLRLGDAWPHRFTHIVNIDGMPSRSRQPDMAEMMRTRLTSGELSGWLDHRQRASGSQRKPDSLQELARRRARMNPRLTHEWLCYLVTVGAERRDDGWRWKIDAMMRMGGFGPWRPEWALDSLSALSQPFLGILGSHEEPMGWGTHAKNVAPALPRHGHLETFEAGHFIHIEQPGPVASLVLDFLGGPR